jgi:signal transduction histidine kinase
MGRQRLDRARNFLQLVWLRRALRDRRRQRERDDGPVPIYGDSQRLSQVFANLLANAIKFTPQGGRVTVSVGLRGSEAYIVVTDTGRGIEADFLPHVFERFRQAETTTTRSVGGVRLGLAIVRSLVELHGGEVRAESDGAGRGACFTITLPGRTRRWPE